LDATKCRFLHIRMFLLPIIVLILFLGSTNSAFAAPFLDDPTKIVVFFSHDSMQEGSSGDQSFDSFSGTTCGVGIPTNLGSIGIKTSTDTSDGYFELFFNRAYNESLLMDLSLSHRDDNGTTLRYSAYRPLVIELSDYQRVNTVFGPGIALLSTDDATTFSIFIEGKANYYFVEGLFAYANAMYDLMYDSLNIEIGAGFSY
jgi:hypothetical protein